MARAPARCVFCAIVTGELPAHFVLEEEDCVAFLDRSPLARGHCLLVPRQHVHTLDDLPAALIAPLFANLQRLSCAVQAALPADGSFAAANTRISQSVPHLHLHMVPRWKKDGLFARGFVWKRAHYADEAEMATVAGAIAASLRSA